MDTKSLLGLVYLPLLWGLGRFWLALYPVRHLQPEQLTIVPTGYVLDFVAWITIAMHCL